MKRVKIGEFRDRASELIRRAAGGETVVIVNRDRPVAKMVPFASAPGSASQLIGSMSGSARISGDVESPIADPSAWFGGREDA